MVFILFIYFKLLILKIIITLKELSSSNAAGKSTLFDMKNSELFLKYLS